MREQHKGGVAGARYFREIPLHDKIAANAASMTEVNDQRRFYKTMCMAGTGIAIGASTVRRMTAPRQKGTTYALRAHHRAHRRHRAGDQIDEAAPEL